MTTENILFKWLTKNTEHASNYFNDFLCLYYADSHIVSYCPQNNLGSHNVYMVPKNVLHSRICKYSNCDKLYYNAPPSMDTHNPYHDSARYLFNSCHKEDDYLRLWLFLLLREYDKKDFAYFNDFRDNFYKTYMELSHYLDKDYSYISFGNAYHMLPTMGPNYSLSSVNKSIDFYLYELQSQMNYVKATNFMVLINERL